MKKINRKANGFTLIELLVVVAIIAILALIVILAINPVEMLRKSHDSRRLSDLSTLRKAIDLSTADGATLPVTGGWCTVDSAMLVTNFCAPALGTGIDISKYLSASPQDPAWAASGTLQALTISSGACAADPAFNKSAMIYEFKSDGSVYVIRGRLESLDNCPALMGDGNVDVYYETGTDPGLDL